MSDKIVDRDIYDKMISTSTRLVHVIYDKQDRDLEITQEEADFANSFMEYANELLRLTENETD